MVGIRLCRTINPVLDRQVVSEAYILTGSAKSNKGELLYLAVQRFVEVVV